MHRNSGDSLKLMYVGIIGYYSKAVACLASEQAAEPVALAAPAAPAFAIGVGCGSGSTSSGGGVCVAGAPLDAALSSRAVDCKEDWQKALALLRIVFVGCRPLGLCQD